jgi:hypothetical protein
VLEKEQMIASTISRYPKGKLVMAPKNKQAATSRPTRWRARACNPAPPA